MSGESKTEQPNPFEDPYGYLGLTLNPDGSITRGDPFYPNIPPTPDPNSSSLVLSQDFPINPSNHTLARVFLPKEALNDNKLPLIVYYHGGGFVFSCSPAIKIHHEFCFNMAAELSAVVVSVEYRLSPEYRLPAAYDDAMEALHWIRTTGEAWLRNHADYSNCFLMGTSAGGNIVYHVGLRVAEEVESLKPLIIKGMILHHPFFGGVQRSASEVRLVNDPVVPLVATDIMWELSLPVGADRDHEYCNPTAGGGSTVLEKISSLGWKVLLTGCSGDPFSDRQMELEVMMKGKGVDVVGSFVEGERHGVEMSDQPKAKRLYLVMKDLLLS